MNTRALERTDPPPLPFFGPTARTVNGAALARGRRPRPKTPPRVRTWLRARVPLAADGAPRLPHVGYDADGYAYESPSVSQNKRHDIERYSAASALRLWLPEHCPNANVESDMHLYWRPRSRSSLSPDVMIALGVADDEDRSSFKTWELRVPDLVIELLSPSTAKVDLGDKRYRYRSLGVRECWLVDLSRRRLREGVVGDRRVGRGRYVPVRPIAGTSRYPSAVVGLDFRVEGGRFVIRDTARDEDLRRHAEDAAGRLAAERERDEERAGRQAAEQEVQRLRRLLRDAGLANGSV